MALTSLSIPISPSPAIPSSPPIPNGLCDVLGGGFEGVRLAEEVVVDAAGAEGVSLA